MNTEKTLKIVGYACTAIGIGISIIQKQLDDKNLATLVKKEVQKQLKNQ